MPPPEAKGSVTLRTVGHALGVSHVTVSLALRNSPKITEELRLRIQAGARRLGYQPNAMATALAYRRHALTAVPVKAGLAWLNQWEDPRKLRALKEFAHYWQGAYAAAEKFGYRLEEFCCGKQMPLDRIENILLARGVHGILLPPHPPGTDWSGLRWERFSAVRFGRSIQNPRLHIVSSDQVANMVLAFRQTQARGYERIGFVIGNSSTNGSLFEAGFLMAQARLKTTVRLPVCVLNESNMAASQKSFARWLRQVRPDAILSDVAATREMLEKMGCKVPDDVGLVAMSVLDGNADAGIDQHPEETGRVAVSLVISLINENALGIPPIFRQSLVEGSWADGSTLPDRSKK